MTATTVPHLIGGSPVDQGTWIPVTDPGKPSEVVGHIVDGTANDARAAIDAAQHAGDGWAALDLDTRAGLLREGLQRVRARSTELHTLLMRENGALRFEAELDLSRSLELSEDIIVRGLTHLQPRVTRHGDDTITVLRQPIGPVALIVPWNSPTVLAASKVAPALLAGNTIILKPSPEAPLALSLALTILASALPAGVVNVVNGAESVGVELSSNPAVRKISFTGSTAVGTQILQAAAHSVKRVSLELGGNDPAIVLDDADLDVAIPLLTRGVFTRAGQICFAVKRIYVDHRIYDAFIARFREHVDTLVTGYGDDAESAYGPLINAAQLRRVRALVQQAAELGATVEPLGRVSPEGISAGGYYHLPTLVTGAAQESPLVQGEQFGPVIPVLPFATDADAIAYANDSPYGLASSVWSTDPARAHAVAAQLEAGCTFINSHNIWSLSFDMPFGGVKHSGIGRERTELGLDEYVETHAIRTATPSTPPTPTPPTPPTDSKEQP